LVKEKADRLGLRTKARRPNNGRPSGNLLFTRGHLYKLHANPLYAGMIAHKGQRYDGQHTSIIDRPIWDRVQALLAESSVNRSSGKNTKPRHAFAGRIFDETGDSLRPLHASKKGRRYHYYVSSRLFTAPGNPDPAGWRLPVRELEQVIGTIVTGWLEDSRALEAALLPPDARIAERGKLASAAQRIVDAWQQVDPDSASIADLVHRIDLAPSKIRISLDHHQLCEALNHPLSNLSRIS
jgi:hypothetical protein